MTTRLIRRRERLSLASQWVTANPVLLLGEMGFDETGVKVGDGATAWNSLDYLMRKSLMGQSSRWLLLPELLRYCATLKNGFNAYAPDTTYTVGAAGSNLYFDTINGNDSLSGATPALAKKTVPTNTTALAGNTKYWIAAGSKIYLDYTTALRGLNISGNGTIVCAYDRLTNNEIFHQPNPFERAYLGQEITEYEKNTLYFQIIGNAPDIPPFSGTTGAAMRISGTGAVVRGAWTYGNSYGNYTNGGDTIEDCIFEKCQRNTSHSISDPAGTSVNNYGGAGIQNIASVAGGRYARFMVERPGEDALWFGASGAAPAGFALTDFAIRHWCDKQISNQQHADVLQCGSSMGAALIRRGIFEHLVKTSVLASTVPSSAPVGAGLQFGVVGGNATGMLIQQVAGISNHNVWNDAGGQTGKTLDRLVMGVKRHGVYFDPIDGTTPLYCNPFQLANVAMAQTNCLAFLLDGRFKNVASGDVLFGPAAYETANITNSEWQRHLG